MPDTIPPSAEEQEEASKESLRPVAPSKPKVDWVAAKNFYLQNPTSSYADVAQQFDTSPKNVEAHGSKENWGAAREELGERITDAVEGEVIAQSRDRNEVHAIGAKNLQGLIQKKMEIALNHLKDLESKVGEGETLNPYDKGIISDKGLADLANAYITAVNLERVTLNLPTSVERKEITGQNGKDLFGDGHNAKLNGLIIGAISALAERRKDDDSQPSS